MMNKTTNKISIVIGAGVLSIFAFCILFTSPIKANAFYYVGFVNGNYIGCETDLDSYGNFKGCGHVEPVVVKTTSATTSTTTTSTTTITTTTTIAYHNITLILNQTQVDPCG